MIAERYGQHRLFPSTHHYTHLYSSNYYSVDSEYLSRKNLEKWEWKIQGPYELSRWES